MANKLYNAITIANIDNIISGDLIPWKADMPLVALKEQLIANSDLKAELEVAVNEIARTKAELEAVKTDLSIESKQLISYSDRVDELIIENENLENAIFDHIEEDGVFEEIERIKYYYASDEEVAIITRPGFDERICDIKYANISIQQLIDLRKKEISDEKQVTSEIIDEDDEW